jgi:6-phosphogluconolactonase
VSGPGRLQILDGAEAVSREAADQFVAVCADAMAARGRFIVALAGGSTPRRLYELLATAPRRDGVDWKRVEFFWGDERAVPREHPDSNHGMAARALLETLELPDERVHRIHAERADRAAAAREYQEDIARTFGVDPDGPPPAFDLILLGMGADGHTASLFPGTPALDERRRWVIENRVESLGTERITFTAPLILGAREIRVVTAGAEKAAALKAVREGPRDPRRLPSQLLAGAAGRLVWIVDRAAASQLTTTEGGRAAEAPSELSGGRP